MDSGLRGLSGVLALNLVTSAQDTDNVPVEILRRLLVDEYVLGVIVIPEFAMIYLHATVIKKKNCLYYPLLH